MNIDIKSNIEGLILISTSSILKYQYHKESLTSRPNVSFGIDFITLILKFPILSRKHVYAYPLLILVLVSPFSY